MKLPAFQIQPGDLIDLEGDKYADPNHNRIEFETEYALVDTVEQETPQCVAIWIDGVDCFGFPTNHLIDVVRSAV